MKRALYTSLLVAASSLAAMGNGYSTDNSVLYMSMDVKEGSYLNAHLVQKNQTIKVPIHGNFSPMSIKGMDGNAWRTDGYTSYATENLGDVYEGNKVSMRVRFAIDTYPVINSDEQGYTEEKIPVVTCLDEEKHTGFGFYLGRTGKYSFKMYAGGELVEIEASNILPLWQWDTLLATYDGETGKVELWCNGKPVGTATGNGGNVKVQGDLWIGWDTKGNKHAGAAIGAFNGAIDHIRVNKSVDAPSTHEPTEAYLNYSRATRYADDIMRPHYHPAPLMNWTNETHGLIKYKGKYHLFYQKTGSAPVMSSMHWGHLVSEDLVTWQDEKPVLAPGEWYDIKGCWSGCVFTDELINDGKPTILYTGVDYAKPYGALAYSTDDALRNWTKDSANPCATIEDSNGRHFRDTYYFRDGDDRYFIIGCSEDGRASTLLYKYNTESKQWEPKGNFYLSPNKDTDGEFAEMPNVVKFGDRWMMTTTPFGSSRGVTCNYRTGKIENGKFIPDARFTNPKQVDVLGEKGFGLLSPSPYTDENGQVIAVGLVPDKLPTHYNLEHGYAHLYSLPRIWTLVEDGDLMQKPYPKVCELRRATYDERQIHIDEQFGFENSFNLVPVRGREVEIDATFVVGDETFGVEVYKDEEGKCAKIAYNPANHELSVDFGAIARYDQDEGNPNRFSAILEKVPAKGQDFNLHVFVDHSILEIFVNDRYASSVRVFPKDENANVVGLFSTGTTTVKKVDAWIMNRDPSSDPEIITPPEPEVPETNGKVAMWVPYANEDALKAGSDDERVAAEYFYDEFIKDVEDCKAAILYAGDIDKVDPNNFDCIWIHIDRENQTEGWQALPSPFNKQETIDKLNAYVKAGGNLYLSTYATQLAYAMGRMSHPVNKFDNGNGAIGDDVWQANISVHDNSLNHPMFNGIDKIEAGYGTLINLLGNNAGLHRQDHNCMWNIESTCNGINRFHEIHNARVLGTWGHDGGQEHAGIIEFLPEPKTPPTTSMLKSISDKEIDARKGTIITNGLAATEWHNPGENTNLYADNIKKMTTNALSYLSPAEWPDYVYTGVETVTESEADQMTYIYNVAGLCVAKGENVNVNELPAGVYIVKNGTTVRKIRK